MSFYIKTILGLAYLALLPVVATFVLYFFKEKTAFAKLSEKTKQIIYGFIFGGLAIIGSEFGVDIGGAIANTRDASVLTAGLVFGGPSGIISGLLSGVERYLSVYWGGGTYTQFACSLSTIIAGFLGATLRKYIFDGKKPSPFYALSIGFITEVFHMLMIFFTNMNDIANAFFFVRLCSIPMVLVNGLAVMFSVLVVSFFHRKAPKTKRKRSRKISVVAQQWLLICVLVAFLTSSIFTIFLQSQISEHNADELLYLNICDMQENLLDECDYFIRDIMYSVTNEYSQGRSIEEIEDLFRCNEIFVEISVVDKNGIVVDSTYKDFIGYDMASGEQSAEFLKLLDKDFSFVQEFQPTSFDPSVSKKYGGSSLENDGFILVAYEEEAFKDALRDEITRMPINQRIGQTGYILIVSSDFEIVSVTVDFLSGGFDIGESFFVDTEEKVSFSRNLLDKDVFCMYQRLDDYYIIGVLPVDEATFSRNLSIYIMAFMEIIIFVALFILIYFLIKKVVVDNITRINICLDKITAGDLNVVVDVRSNEEFASLSDDINSTVDTLKKYIAEAAARLDRELEVAKVIQESSLPSVFPPFPDKKELDIFALMDPAKEVGGDFYDFYLLDDNHLAFLVADVSGKGITGAMFMMKAKAIIKHFATTCSDVAEILSNANKALCEGNEAEMFVTCFMGILDIKNEKIEFANAGHNPPLIQRKNGSFEYFKARSNFVLAGFEDSVYRKGEVDFNYGDSIFLYTDGVTEATNVEDALYGSERLYKILNADNSNALTETSEATCSKVKADLGVFVGEAEQFDDITMLCVKLKSDSDKRGNKND